MPPEKNNTSLLKPLVSSGSLLPNCVASFPQFPSPSPPSALERNEHVLKGLNQNGSANKHLLEVLEYQASSSLIKKNISKAVLDDKSINKSSL